MIDHDETTEEGAKVIAGLLDDHSGRGRAAQVTYVDITNAVGMFGQDQWERGYAAAVAVARKSGAVDLATYMEASLEAYWRSQGIVDG